MNNLPENEKQVDLETESEEEFSTVFSDPSQDGKRSSAKQKKLRWPVVAAAVLAVAVLAGVAVAVVKFIPEMTDDSTSSETEEFSVLELDSDEFKTVKVKNENGSFNFYSETEKDSDGNESISWYVEGYEKNVVSTDAIADIVSSAAQISAFREITTKTSEECGFNEPVATVDITTADDAKLSVLVGSVSPDGRGTYLKLSTDDKIYLVESYYVTAFVFEELDLADTEDFEGIELDSGYSDYTDDSGLLETFDSLTVTGANFPEAVVIKPNTNETISQYASFVVSSPKSRIAGNVDDLFAVFQAGLTVEGAYSFDVSDKTVRELGFDDPDFTAKLKIKDKTFTYKFKLQSDGNYAVISDSSLLVKSVSPDELSFINYKTNDFYSNWVCIETIDTLSGFTYESGDTHYSFSISREDVDSEYNISCNGSAVKASYFQDFYEEFVSLTCSEYTTESLSAQPTYTVTLSFNDGRSDAVLTFTKATETKYQYALNGVDMGRVSASSLKKISKYVAKAAAGESIK